MFTDYELARFWSKVDVRGEFECWEWREYCFNGETYGQFSFRGKPVPASRAIFQHLIDRELDRWVLVCHHCDNPKCVNPKHLFLGSNSDNMMDCSHKGRLHTARGSRSNLAKITDEQALEIRALAGKLPQNEVAKKYGVSRPLVSMIWCGKAWSHLGPVEGYTPRKIARKEKRQYLNEEQVKEIRRLFDGGVSQKEIAEKFGITTASASLICNRKQWAHVT